MYIKNTKIYVLILLFFGIFFTGCSQKTSTDQTLVKKFKEEKQLANKDETLVYVIRKNQMVGAARLTDLGCNDLKYSLTTGSYAVCRFNNNINTVSLAFEKYPIKYNKIDNRLGETIFLYYDFNLLNSTLNEIDSDLGMTMVMNAQEKTVSYEEEFDKKINDFTGKRILSYDYGHQIALLNPHIVNIDILKYDENINNLELNKSRIIFLRFEDNLDKTSIWSKDNFLGSLNNNEYLTIDVSPGLHSFFTKYGAWGIIDINAKAGKTYYVDVDNIFGWNEIYTKLKLMDTIPNLSEYKKIVVDPTKITPSIQQRLDEAIKYINIISKDKESKTIYDYSIVK